MKKIIMAVLVVALGAGGGLYYMGYLDSLLGASVAAEGAEGEAEVAVDAHGEPIAAAGTPVYLSLEPPFVVNFMHRGTLRYLQMSLDLMFKDEKRIEEVKARMPAIRNDLILLLSSQEFEVLSTPEGKDNLRTQIMQAVNHVLGIKSAGIESRGNEPDSAVYITNFVMQ